jgi:hypothetical protein
MSVIPKIPRASGGQSPPGPIPGFYPGPAGDLKRSPDPLPTHAPPPPNHKSWIRPWYVSWIYNYICNRCEIESHSGEVYSIQHHDVIKFVSDLRQVGGFLWVLRFPPPIKLTAMIQLIISKMFCFSTERFHAVNNVYLWLRSSSLTHYCSRVDTQNVVSLGLSAIGLHEL